MLYSKQERGCRQRRTAIVSVDGCTLLPNKKEMGSDFQRVSNNGQHGRTVQYQVGGGAGAVEVGKHQSTRTARG